MSLKEGGSGSGSGAALFPVRVDQLPPAATTTTTTTRTAAITNKQTNKQATIHIHFHSLLRLSPVLLCSFTTHEYDYE